MAYPTDPIYKLGKNPLTGVVDQVTKESNGTILIIPFIDANADYQTYLAWVAEGNTAEAAD